MLKLFCKCNWYRYVLLLFLINLFIYYCFIAFYLCISIGELVELLHKNHFSKTFFWSTYSIYCTPENKIWFDLFMMFLKKNLVIVWYFTHLEYEFRTLFELKSNSKIEDINESFRDYVFTRFWTFKIFL